MLWLLIALSIHTQGIYLEIHIVLYTYTIHILREPFSFHVVISRPKIEFHIPMNGTAYIYQNYTASCMIHANPKMNVYISSTQDCDFQHEASQIGQYTTEATITINNITSACTVITCSANLFQEHRMLGKEYNKHLSP